MLAQFRHLAAARGLWNKRNPGQSANACNQIVERWVMYWTQTEQQSCEHDAENPRIRMCDSGAQVSVGGLQRHKDVTLNVVAGLSCNNAVAAW